MSSGCCGRSGPPPRACRLRAAASQRRVAHAGVDDVLAGSPCLDVHLVDDGEDVGRQAVDAEVFTAPSPWAVSEVPPSAHWMQDIVLCPPTRLSETRAKPRHSAVRAANTSLKPQLTRPPLATSFGRTHRRWRGPSSFGNCTSWPAGHTGRNGGLMLGLDCQKPHLWQTGPASIIGPQCSPRDAQRG